MAYRPDHVYIVLCGCGGRLGLQAPEQAGEKRGCRRRAAAAGGVQARCVGWGVALHGAAACTERGGGGYGVSQDLRRKEGAVRSKGVRARLGE